MKRWRVAGVNFDHFHMGDNLRMAADHPQVDMVALCDPTLDRMRPAQRDLGLSEQHLFTDVDACLEQTQPDLVLLCPAAAEHGVWTERVAPYGVDMLIEKPFAASLEEADRMIAAARQAGGRLAINWPMAWYPTNQTAHRLIEGGEIGDVLEVHYYDGNRGPLWHTAGKQERTPEQVEAEKPTSWFYSKAHGGGALLDYLGYGATLATWFNGGQIPQDVSCMVHQPTGLEVDEHAIAVIRYVHGLSKFETRWGTFTDPWTHQPQPKCGFVIVGTAGTVSSYDFEDTIRLQTQDHPQGQQVPVDAIHPPHQNPIQYVLDCLEQDREITGPLSVECSRIGQQIVDAAVASSQQQRTVPIAKV